MVDIGFEIADSRNLPELGVMECLDFFARNGVFNSIELRIVKTKSANYGDRAVGRVQIKRVGSDCTVLGEITEIIPEHKPGKAIFKVSAVIDEKEGTVVYANCRGLDSGKGCAVGAGRCKHVVAFLFWLHRRSEEPTPRETVSYWTKGKLSSDLPEDEFILASKLGPKLKSISVNDMDVDDFVAEVEDLLVRNDVDCAITRYLLHKHNGPTDAEPGGESS